MNLNLTNVFKPKFFGLFKKGRYDKKTFMSDLIAGIIVGIIALPLAIAFGIASGVTPQQGLITAIVAGFLISFFGELPHRRTYRRIHRNRSGHRCTVWNAGPYHSNHHGRCFPGRNGSVQDGCDIQIHPISYRSWIHQRYRTYDFFYTDERLFWLSA